MNDRKRKYIYKKMDKNIDVLSYLLTTIPSSISIR